MRTRENPQSLSSQELLSIQPLNYSLRRYYVDQFHLQHLREIPSGSRVLNLGGIKNQHRGAVRYEKYALRMLFVNLPAEKRADVHADAANTPFKDGCFEVAICSETLEHVSDPQKVLREIHRLLRPGGITFICVPFLYRKHGDPFDYGRYTDHYWREKLTEIGFVEIQIQKQGFFWSVLVDMLRDWVRFLAMEGRPGAVWLRKLLEKVIRWIKQKAIITDSRTTYSGHHFWGQYTTGFGIKASKR